MYDIEWVWSVDRIVVWNYAGQGVAKFGAKFGAKCGQTKPRQRVKERKEKKETSANIERQKRNKKRWQEEKDHLKIHSMQCNCTEQRFLQGKKRSKRLACQVIARSIAPIQAHSVSPCLKMYQIWCSLYHLPVCCWVVFGCKAKELAICWVRLNMWLSPCLSSWQRKVFNFPCPFCVAHPTFSPSTNHSVHSYFFLTSHIEHFLK